MPSWLRPKIPGLITANFGVALSGAYDRNHESGDAQAMDFSTCDLLIQPHKCHVATAPQELAETACRPDAAEDLVAT